MFRFCGNVELFAKSILLQIQYCHKNATISLRLVEKPTQFSNFFELFLHACHTVNNPVIALNLSEEFIHGLTFLGENTNLSSL